MYTPSPCLLQMYLLTTLWIPPLSSVAFCDDSEHHDSDEESLSQELRDIMQKVRQRKERRERRRELSQDHSWEEEEGTRAEDST